MQLYGELFSKFRKAQCARIALKKNYYLGWEDDILFLICLCKFRRLAHREISYPFNSCNRLDHFDSKNDYRVYVCRNVRPCCHHQANEKANEALANEDYNHLHDTLAKCSVRSKYKYAAHSFKRTWRCPAICFEKVFLYKLTSVFFASTDFLVQFCYKALFRHWNYLLSPFALFCWRDGKDGLKQINKLLWSNASY